MREFSYSFKGFLTVKVLDFQFPYHNSVPPSQIRSCRLLITWCQKNPFGLFLLEVSTWNLAMGTVETVHSWGTSTVIMMKLLAAYIRDVGISSHLVYMAFFVMLKLIIKLNSFIYWGFSGFRRTNCLGF